jgi:hypothetical protein
MAFAAEKWQIGCQGFQGLTWVGVVWKEVIMSSLRQSVVPKSDDLGPGNEESDESAPYTENDQDLGDR